MFSFEISFCPACIPFSSALRNDPKPSPLQEETVGLLKTLGTVPNYSPHCTMGKIDTWGTVSHCNNGGNRWTGIIPIHPHLFCRLYCPSHHTIRENGQTGIIPRCPIGYTLFLLYHTIYHPHSAGCLLWFNAPFLSH